jgi:hypothetical protein
MRHSRIACFALMVVACNAFMMPTNILSLRHPKSRSVVSVGPRAMCEPSTADRVAEIKSVLAELAAFRGRIVDDAVAVAKKIKAKPREVQSALDNNPDVKKIDEAVALLEAELKTLEG